MRSVSLVRSSRRGSSSDDSTVLGVEPGETTPWGSVDRKWGGDVYVDVDSLFVPGSYCPTGRFDEAPRAVRRAFRVPTRIVVQWVDPGNNMYPGIGDPDAEERGERLRDLTTRFTASTDQQRTAFAGAVLAAARDCDIAEARKAAAVLTLP